jgi:hypothetical protein
MKMMNSFRMINLKALARVSQFFGYKISFKMMGRKEILMFLGSYRKSDAADPMHKWIGTYNLLLIILIRFFKWLYSPELAPIVRKKPSLASQLDIYL